MNDIQIGDLQAIVLAGGKGTRLRPFTVVLPKPLVPVGEMSILEVLLTRLGNFGLRRITISTGYLAELIVAVAGDGSKYGVEITYCHEEQPLGTAGPISLLESDANTVIAMNGDLLTTLNFNNLVAYHASNRADITIATYERNVKIDFGVIDLDETGEFAGFREKPTYSMDVSMGVNVLSRSAIELVEPGKRLDMPDLIMKVKNNGGSVCCYKEECFWLDIGRIDDYERAQQIFDEKKSEFLGLDFG